MNNDNLQLPFLKPAFIKNAPEQWRPIQILPIIPNLYEISDAGHVRNMWTGQYIPRYGIMDPDAYITVKLATMDGDFKSFYVHRLVCITFIPNPQNKPFVNHIGGNIKMPYTHLLEWATEKENSQDAVLRGELVGENRCNSKFTNEEVLQIAQMLKNGMRYKDILEKLGREDTFNNRIILSSIKNKKCWSMITQDYSFDNINYKHNDPVFNTEQIHQICKYIANGYKTIDILRLMIGDDKATAKGNYVKYNAITRIKSKLTYKEISDEYF